MNLEQQVCSLDLARRLKHFGVKKQSLFAWYHDREHFSGDELVHASNLRVEINVGESDLSYPVECLAPAFTVAELGEMLPDYIKEGQVGHLQQRSSKLGTGWCVEYVNRDEYALRQDAEVEADARAKMLVYLLENKLVTLAKTQ